MRYLREGLFEALVDIFRLGLGLDELLARFIYMRYATGLIRDAGRLLHLLVAILTCAYFANRKNLIVNAASAWKS